MTGFRSILLAARPDQAALAPCAAFVGSSYARFDAQPGPGVVAELVVLVAAFLAAIGVGLVDHAWDRLGAPPPDPKRPRPDDDAVDPRDAAISGGIAFVLALACGAILLPLSGPAAIGYGALAVLLGVARSAPVAGLDTLGRGLGDIAGVLALGPLAVLAGFAARSGHGGTGAFIAGLPAGATAASALYVRHFVRRDADLRHDRLTPVAVFGEARARSGFVVFPLVAAAAIVIVASAGEYPPAARWAILPLAVSAASTWRLRPDGGDADDARHGKVALIAAIVTLVALGVTLRAAARA